MGYRRETLTRGRADPGDLTIETDRLVLVPVTRAHRSALRDLLTPDEGRDLSTLLDECARGHRAHWLLRRREEGAPYVGLCGFNAWFVRDPGDHDGPRDWGELSYYLHPDHRGLGLMTEALTAVLACGFQVLRMSTVAALVASTNQRSIALLDRAGFSPLEPVAGSARDAESQILLYTREASAR